MSRQTDVQSETPDIRIPLTAVGVTNMTKEVVFNGGSRNYNVLADISVFTDVPGTQRGMHMSRTGEAVMDIIENAFSASTKTFERLCSEISSRVLEVSDGSTYAYTKLRGTLVVRKKSKVNGRITSDPVHVFASSRVTKGGSPRNTIGVSVVGMTVCPCAKQMVIDYSRELLKNEAEKLKISEDVIERILYMVPVASHVQRGVGRIMVHGVEPGIVDVYDLVDLIEEAMSAPTQDILKRVDEASLIRMGFEKPRFVEDAVRNMAKTFWFRYSTRLPPDTQIIFSQRNFESIHKHDAFAKLALRMDELGRFFEGYR
jgi:GTP cyclohydrolase-4